MDFEKLIAYQKAFDNAMMIFEISKTFPKEETYSLTDQIRRSSRSVAANMSEAYRKRRYPKQDYDNAYQNAVEIGKLINYMINNPDKFGSSKP